MNIELKILDWFQTLHTPVLDKFMTSVTKLGNAGIFWIILTVLFLLIPKMRKTGVVMAAALIIDLLLCNVLLKNLVARTRPYDVNTGIQLLVAKLRDYSFPSGHTAASFASAAALYFAGEKKLWKPALVLACLIAVSRLYLYVHYPTDILAGIILASRMYSGQPASGQAYESDAIAAAVLGGTSFNGGIGTVGGTLIGALVIGFLTNGLNLLHISSYVQMIIKGLVIIGAVGIDILKNRKKQ